MIYGQAESAIPSPEPLGRPACERRGRLPETASCIRKEKSRQPILKTLKRDHQILIANCVHARANLRSPAELFDLLQIGHRDV